MQDIHICLFESLSFTPSGLLLMSFKLKCILPLIWGIAGLMQSVSDILQDQTKRGQNYY